MERSRTSERTSPFYPADPYEVLLEHLETFLSRAEEARVLGGLPWWVERELRG